MSWVTYYQLILLAVFIGLLVASEVYCYNFDNLQERSALFRASDRWQNLCHQLGVQTWAVFGTLLGAIRQNTAVDNEDDVDFGLHQDDWEKVVDALPCAGFRAENYWSGSLIHVICCDSGTVVDVFLYGQKADGVSLGMLGRAYECWGDDMTLEPEQCGEGGRPDLLDVPFGPGRVRVPKNSEKLLAQHYGTDWRKPKRWAGHTVFSVRGSYVYGIVIGTMLLLVLIPSVTLQLESALRPKVQLATSEQKKEQKNQQTN